MRDPTPLTDGAAQRLQEAADAAANTVELSFEITGRTLPQDHRAALADALLSTLPWLADEPTVAVHPLRAPVGEAGQLLLPRRARLLLRLPRQRVGDAPRALRTDPAGGRPESAGGGLRCAPRAARHPHPACRLRLLGRAPGRLRGLHQRGTTQLGIESPCMSGGQRQALGPDGQTWLHGLGLAAARPAPPARPGAAGDRPGAALRGGLFKPHKLITGLSSEDD